LDRLKEAFAAHPQIQFTACDVADESAVISFVEFVRSRSPKVDVLINCAGGFGAIGAIDQIDSQTWMRTFHDNLFGTFLTIKNFLPLLALGDAPQVLNFSGGGAFNPFPNFSAYACSKAAIVRLTETLAIELAPRGITVNAIAPGIVTTKVHESTLEAGAERAGLLQYRRTQDLMRDRTSEQNQARMVTVQDCVKALISNRYFGLTGKTISANFDPWSSDTFQRHIVEITRSELYTMRRTNLSNLPDGMLRSNLMKTWARHGTRR
jgi:NAD(P)-dependent dehydrogenase (short-subunit alcohol dehydrogenase family)